MSTAISMSVTSTIVNRLGRDETQEKMMAMSQQMRQSALNGQFGRSTSDVETGLSLAASLRDPIFWKKLDLLLHYRFDV